MDDISGKINDILNDEESMSQIMQIAQSLGLSGDAGEKQENNSNGNINDISQNIGNIMNAVGGNSGQSKPKSDGNEMGLDIGMLMKIQQAMSSYNQSNKNVDLLRALKPHFGEERQKKVDDAIKIMQLMNMLPLLKKTGLFNFLGSEDKQIED